MKGPKDHRDFSVGDASLNVVPLQSKDHFASLTCSKAKIHKDAIKETDPSSVSKGMRLSLRQKPL